MLTHGKNAKSVEKLCRFSGGIKDDAEAEAEEDGEDEARASC